MLPARARRSGRGPRRADRGRVAGELAARPAGRPAADPLPAPARARAGGHRGARPAPARAPRARLAGSRAGRAGRSRTPAATLPGRRGRRRSSTRARRSTCSGPGFLPHHDEEWARPQRQRVEELALEALEWIARSALAVGGDELGAAERAARELVGRSRVPRERPPAADGGAGRGAANAAEALRVYEELRVLLRDELGVAPAARDRRAAPAPGRRRRRRASACPLPAILAPRGRSAFIGRAVELDALRGGVGHGPLGPAPLRPALRPAGDRQDAAGRRARAGGAGRRHRPLRELPAGAAAVLPARSSKRCATTSATPTTPSSPARAPPSSRC